MLAPEITLEAALRDLDSEREHYRHQAARNLAPALLAELGTPGPRWGAAAEHGRGSEVTTALLALVDGHEPAQLRGLAALGLGNLGEPRLVEAVRSWLRIEGDDDERVYLRECAVISLSFLGRAAQDAAAEPALVQAIVELIESALDSTAPDLRFQAAVALVELRGAAAEAALVQALQREADPQVREGMVDAISYLDPPGPAACDALEALLEGEDAEGPLGFLAAMTLAAARRPSARPRLMAGLEARHERDDALEALAALGRADAAQVERVHRLARRVWLPAITRVRAAYALARMVPPGQGDNPGRALLRRLRWHPRPAVREAVDDAVRNLADLDAREG